MWFRKKHIATIHVQVNTEAEKAVTELQTKLEQEGRRNRELAHRILQLDQEIASKSTPSDLAKYDFSIINETVPVPYSKPRTRYFIRYHPLIKHPDTHATIPGEILKAALDIFPIDTWKWEGKRAQMLFSNERLPTWPEVNDKLYLLREHLTKIINNAADVSKLVQILSPDKEEVSGPDSIVVHINKNKD